MPLLEVHPTALAGDAYLGGTVSAAEVAELRLQRWPPEVVLRDGRIGCVSGARRRDLELFGRLHGIPFVDRPDLWSLLTEEFLDTEFDLDHQERTLCALQASGLPREEVQAIRRFIRLPMLAVTALTWEWQHFGLWDLLHARPVRLLPAGWGKDARFLPPDASTATLRRWAEGIANRAPVTATAARPPEPDQAAVLAALAHRFVSPAFGLGVALEGWRQAHDRLRELQAPLLAAWRAPHRAYHGPRHLLAVLDAIRPFQPERAFVLAAWFHDAVYEPGRPDNEEESARWLERATAPLVADGVLQADDVRLAARMVRATARPLEPRGEGPEGQAIGRFIDADFQVFASLPEDYDDYVAGVRAEHGFVSDEAFRIGRRAFLERLRAEVDRRGFFFREASPLAEWLAVRNLGRELARLG